MRIIRLRLDPAEPTSYDDLLRRAPKAASFFAGWRTMPHGTSVRDRQIRNDDELQRVMREYRDGAAGGQFYDLVMVARIDD